MYQRFSAGTQAFLLPNKNPTAQEKPLQARQIILFPILSILYISGQFGQPPILHTIMHDTERYITI